MLCLYCVEMWSRTASHIHVTLSRGQMLQLRESLGVVSGHRQAPGFN